MGKIILGAGISGLSSAHYLLKKCPAEAITVIQNSNRTGGWVKSNEQSDGTIFEEGPRTLRPVGPAGANTLRLVEELKLSDKIIPINRSHPAARNRMIYVNGQLQLLPKSLLNLFIRQEPFSKPLIYYIVNEYFTPSKKAVNNDESIYDFTKRRFGSEISDYLISPMICGICGGDAKNISVKFLMESLFQKEQEHGSIIKGYFKTLMDRTKNSIDEGSSLVKRAKHEAWSVYSFKGGMQTLTDAIYNNINKSVKFEFNSECAGLNFDNEVTVSLKEGGELKGDHVISAISAESLSKLVQTNHPELSELLNKIKTVSICVINLRYNRHLIQQEGFGFLVPPKENLPLLGVIYDSCCFPYENATVLTAMLGGYCFKRYFGENPKEEDVLQITLSHIKETLKIDIEPDMFKVNILKDCIPQYHVGHSDNVKRINKYIQDKNLKLSLCGSSYYGVGINDVILSAKRVIDNL